MTPATTPDGDTKVQPRVVDARELRVVERAAAAAFDESIRLRARTEEQERRLQLVEADRRRLARFEKRLRDALWLVFAVVCVAMVFLLGAFIGRETAPASTFDISAPPPGQGLIFTPGGTEFYIPAPSTPSTEL